MWATGENVRVIRRGSRMVMSAFLSHSGADDRYVKELEQLVRKLGFDDIFNDGDTIVPDEKFWPRIDDE